MRIIPTYKQFLEKKDKEDFEDKIKDHGYYKGISTSTARKKEDQMKKQGSMDDDNPDAYKELPGDCIFIPKRIYTWNYLWIFHFRGIDRLFFYWVIIC